MRRNALRGPGINNWDFSIQKDIKFTETKSLEFRGEFFNAFNHVQFYVAPRWRTAPNAGSTVCSGRFPSTAARASFSLH